MSTNRVIYGIVAIALLITAVFVTQTAVATTRLVSTVREARAAEADVARWVALGEYYSKLNSPASSFDPLHSREADAARWAGLGRYYEEMQAYEIAREAHQALIIAARYTGIALLEYERSGNTKLLPACISKEMLVELPAKIGDNQWKQVVPTCSQ